MALKMRSTGLGHGVYKDDIDCRTPDWLKMKNPALAARREAEEDWGK
jgi:hypothetical protein